MNSYCEITLRFFSIILPWAIRRKLFNEILGYKIDSKARISSLAWIRPKHLIMAPGTYIGPFTVAINIDLIDMEENAYIGRNNWITGNNVGTSEYFQNCNNRISALLMKNNSSITKHHIIDCTDQIVIGEYATIAGYYSQFLTHGINIINNHQECAAIIIGSYTLIGTGVIILGGAVLPSYSVLGAGSVLIDNYTKSHMLYGGTPAKPIKDISRDAKYFNRASRIVN